MQITLFSRFMVFLPYTLGLRYIPSVGMVSYPFHTIQLSLIRVSQVIFFSHHLVMSNQGFMNF